MKNRPASEVAHTFDRRSFLQAAASTAGFAIAASGTARAQDFVPSLRLPDPAVKSLDPSFDALINNLSTIERIATGFSWTEGPVWLGVANMLVFSDIRGNRLMKWDPVSNQASVFRAPSHYANGNTVDRQGRLITCQGETRSITRTEFDGTITTLADSYQGKPFNSPNDIVCHSDGGIWFTDPDFGPNFAEGALAPGMPARVYRIDPVHRRVEAVAENVPGPNGLCFSPDEKILYVIASRHKPDRQIWAYDVAQNKLSRQRVFLDCGPGTADGFRSDIHGNLWCGWGTGPGLDGVAVFNPAGHKIGQIELPERCPNLCFSGPNRNELLMTCHTSIYKLTLKTQGVKQTT